MARFSMSVSMEGSGLRFENRLLALEKNLLEMRLASNFLMEEFEKYTKSRWGEGVTVTESTLERWPDWRSLENTEALKESFTNTSAPGAVREITPYGFKWGSSIFYAKFLWKGTRKMSPKPVVQMIGLRALAGYQMRRWVLKGTGLDI